MLVSVLMLIASSVLGPEPVLLAATSLALTNAALLALPAHFCKPASFSGLGLQHNQPSLW